MEDKKPTLIDYLLICVKWRKMIIIHVLIMGILAVCLSLIVPIWYKGSAAILPPSTEEESTGFSALLTQIPIPSSLLGLGGATQSASLVMAILQSRTIMEAVVHKFNLIERYKSKNMEDAVRTLVDRCSFEVEEEGTICISVSARTGFFHPKDQVDEARVLAKDMTNFLIQQLDYMNKKLRTEKARNLRIFLEKRYDENLKDLADIEEALRVFQEKYGAISLPDQTIAAIEVAASLKAEIISKEIEIGVLQQMVGSGHSDYTRAVAELLELEKGYRFFEIGDGKDEGGLFPPFEKIPEYGLEYARLYRDIKLQEILLEFLVPQYEQAKIQEAKDTPTIQVLDEAVLPIRKTKPKRALVVILAVLLSFIVSIFYAMFMERMRSIRLAGGDDYEKYMWLKNQFRNDAKRLFRKKKKL